MMKRVCAVILVMSLTGCAASGTYGRDLMSYVAAAFTEGYEKLHHARFTDRELVPFKSSVPGTRKWKAATSSALPPTFQFPTVVWAEFPTCEWLLQLEVYDTPDNDGLVHHVLDTLSATAGDPSGQCFGVPFKPSSAPAGWTQWSAASARKREPRGRKPSG